MANVIKNGNFTRGVIDSHGWFVPVNWSAYWREEFNGTFSIESVGEEYHIDSGILLSFTEYDPWSSDNDSVGGNVFAPGLYQRIDLSTYNDIGNVTFNFRMCFDNYSEATGSGIDLYIYRASEESEDPFYLFSEISYLNYVFKKQINASSEMTEYTVITSLDPGVYTIGITPRIDQLEIMTTNVVVDSFACDISTTDNDITDTGIINNGSFKYWDEDSNIPTDWEILSAENVVQGSFSISRGTDIYDQTNCALMNYYTGLAVDTVDEMVPPGLYQHIDLSNHKYGANLNIEFGLYTIEIPSDYTCYCEFFVYEAVYDDTTNTYVPEGGYADYVYRESILLDDSATPEWQNISLTIPLKRGHYFIGFTPEVLNSDDYGYLRAIHVAIDNVSATTEEISTLDFEYGELIESGSFEEDNSFDTVLDGWETDGIDAIGRIDSRQDIISYGLGVVYCEISYEFDILEEDIEEHFYGLKQIVLSKADAIAQLSFWHYTQLTGNLNFKIAVYKVEYNLTGSSYEVIKPAIFEETVATNNIGWTNYVASLELEYDTNYMVIIYPPIETKNELCGLCVDKVSLVTMDLVDTGHSGEYDSPLTEEDGTLVAVPNESGVYDISFCPFYSLSAGQYFIKISTDYYCTNGAIDSNRLKCYSGTMVQSPGDVSGTRYFFNDGKMARYTTFEYLGEYYEADYTGALTKCVANILNLTASIQSSSILVGESTTIDVSFDDQGFPVKVNAQPSNTSIVTVTDIIGGSSSNQITLIGKSKGSTTVRVYYQNVNGLVVEKNILIYVTDQATSTNDAEIYIPYESNYVESNSSLTVNYCITPEYLTEFTSVEWTSSAPSLANVDIYGNILTSVNSTGSCTITGECVDSGASDSFTLYVVPVLYNPDSIEISPTELSVAIGETRVITAQVLNNVYASYGTIQDVTWKSSDEKIATINKYGFITGVDRGSVTITCTSVADSSVSSSITVAVTGTKITVSDMELNIEEATFNPLYDNNHIKISHKLIPSDTTDTDVVWSSSDENVAIVSQNGYVYLAPSFNSTYYHQATITCASVSRPTIYKECLIKVTIFNDYPITIAAFGDSFSTFLNNPLRIEYEVFNNHNRASEVTYEASILKADGSSTINEITHVEGEYIEISPSETGNFQVTLTCQIPDESTSVTRKVFNVSVYSEDSAPQVKGELSVQYALQNNSFILRCRVEDNIDNINEINYSINFNDGNGYELIYDYPLVYNFTQYQYFFCNNYNLDTGVEYQVTIKATDSQGLETVTNTVSLTIPGVGDYKTSLADAKSDYNIAMDDIQNLLKSIIADSNMSVSDKNEFKTRYEIYCYNYENLRDILNKCIEHINSQISAAQTEMASLADGLSSDSGVAVASYSMDDYTNSNYENVTDMDYYQNKCIQELVARVLELEARLNELTNNNN